MPLEKALRIPFALKDNNGGNSWETAEVAKAVGLAKSNPDFFYLAASSRDFGLTDGSRDSATIALTDFGRNLVYAANSEEEHNLKVQAFLRVALFQRVLEYYKGNNLPDMQYLGNTLTKEFGLDPEIHKEFADLFRQNCAFLSIGSGFSLPPAGTERDVRPKRKVPHPGTTKDSTVITFAEPEKDTGLLCFVIMPFTERQDDHASGFFSEVLRSLIAPAGRACGFRVITANRQGSDVIQKTIVQNLLEADLVIADLTEHNPNVLFELGMRMAEDKPIALIRAKGTGAIFDVDNMLRVYEYAPNLWGSTIEQDLPSLVEHIEAVWEHRDSDITYMKLLRGSS